MSDITVFLVGLILGVLVGATYMIFAISVPPMQTYEKVAELQIVEFAGIDICLPCINYDR